MSQVWIGFNTEILW